MARRKLTKSEQKAVAKKIHKIAHEDEGLSHAAIVGKAVGIVKGRSKKKKKRS